ncbi:MAG: cyclic nucleotide-binding domain-containing protein [Bauldia sp.]
MITHPTFDLGAHGDSHIRFPGGKVVFLKGDPGDCAYVVKRGAIEIRDHGRVLETVGPGGIFGEMAVIDSEPRSASAVAAGPTDLVVIDRSTFEALVREVPDFAVTVIRLISRRLRASNAVHAASDDRLAAV